MPALKSTLKSHAALLVAAAWPLASCGDDTTSRTFRFDDPVEADRSFMPVGVTAAEASEPSPCDGLQQQGTSGACCETDADCDDGDGATVDLCEGTTCVHTENPDACAGDADCDDGSGCTAEVCLGADGRAVAADETGTCAFRGATEGPCCVAGASAVADFDADTLGGLYVTDNAGSGRFWQTDGTRATSGDFALYCGEAATQTYAADVRVKSSATTRPLQIPEGGLTELVLDVFKATRPARNFDVLQVAVLRDEGLFPLWTSRELTDGTTAGAWQTLRIPLGDYAGQAVQLRFIFDSGDAPSAGLEGTYLDTLRLETRCD